MINRWLKKLKRSDSSPSPLPEGWKRFNSVSETKQISKQEQRVLIFKHSTRCPISAAAYDQVVRAGRELPEEVDILFVDVIAERPISNQIADELDVVHQSPQVIFVDNGQVVFKLSHGAIQKNELISRITESVEQSGD